MPNVATTLTPATDAGTLLQRARAARAQCAAEFAASRRAQRERAESDARARLVAALADTLGVSVGPQDVGVEVARDDEYEVSANAYVDVDGLTFSAWRDRQKYRRSGILVVARPCAACGEPTWREVYSLSQLADVLDDESRHEHGCPRDVNNNDAPATLVAHAPTPAERLATAVAEIARAVARDVQSESEGY